MRRPTSAKIVPRRIGLIGGRAHVHGRLAPQAVVEADAFVLDMFSQRRCITVCMY